jgi:dTDP-4-dehydrorhamnose reductase
MADSSVLVTGATGLLGSVLAPHLEQSGHTVIRHGLTGKSDVRADLRDATETSRILDQIRPEVIVNLVALTDVDRCQSFPRDAYLLNVRTVENIIGWILKQTPGVRLIHISTDQVYDGPGPHAEADIAPSNNYAYSKFCSELVAGRVGATILRTNFFGVGTPTHKSFSDWLIAAFSSGVPFKVFTDILFSPLHLDTLVRFVDKVLATPRAGTFNLGSRGGISKRDFSHAVAAHLGLPTDGARDAVSSELDLAAYRPQDMRMNVANFEAAFGVKMPELKDEIGLL